MARRKWYLVSWWVLLLFVASTSTTHAQEKPGELARKAFYQIESRPFSQDVTRKAVEDIVRAQKTAPSDPWVLIAISRALMEQGYLKGNRSKLSSYDAKSMEGARSYAKQALETGRQESMAYVQWARIQIITEDYRGAWETLNQAHKIDPDGFYPWYFRAIISLNMNDPARAEDALNEADSRSVLPYHGRWVAQSRITLAQLKKDPAAEEAYYKKAIALEPQEPHPYGNYAGFLKRHKRYDESITYYEKALAIAPYPLAEEQLRQTRLLRDSAAK